MTHTRLRNITLIAAALIACAYGASRWLGEPDAATLPQQRVAELPPDHPWAPVRTAPPADEAWASLAEFKRLQDQVATLGTAVSALRSSLAPDHAAPLARAAAPDRAPAALSAQELIRQRSDPGAHAQDERDEQALAAERDAAFRREGTDPRWARSTTLALQQALAGDGASVPLAARALECRAQSCRVEIGDDGSDAVDDAVAQFGARFADRLGTMNLSRSRGADGSKALVLYLSR